MFKSLQAIFIFALLTVITQIGGVIYLISHYLYSEKEKYRGTKRFATFVVFYLFSVYIIVPNIAPRYGREKVIDNENIQARSFFYKLTNRNYVKPALNEVLENVSTALAKKDEHLKLVYLDANFPFFDNFPLFPHLSHDDGKKIDISFIYVDEDGRPTNAKPSISGYGVYEGPTEEEYDQISICKKEGNWQYDFPKYLAFGKPNDELRLSNEATRNLVKSILKQKEVSKLFIEPHLVHRLNLNNEKIRFHGCQAVRHDDHIHFQVR